MANVLQITDGSTTVNLNSGTLFLKLGGWTFESSREQVWEVFDVYSRSADSTLRTALINLDKLFTQAARYHADINEHTPVWMYWQSEGESAKRSLVYAGEYQILGESKLTPLLNAGGAKLRITVQRDPYFENTTAANPSTSSLNNSGGKWTIGNDSGSDHQRIDRFRVTKSGIGAYTKFWAGIRPTRKGLTGLTPWWSCDGGTLTDTTVSTSKSGYSGSGHWRTTFAGTPTMAWRGSRRVTDVLGSNYSHMIGRYLVLGRVALGATSHEVVLKITYGWGREFVGTGGVVYLSGNDDPNLVNWNLVPLGEISIPSTGNRDSLMDSEVASFEITLWAERLSVSAQLDTDAFCLIPSEHLFASPVISIASSYYAYAYTNPDNYQYALHDTVNGLQASEYEFNNWYYPVGGGALVVAAQASNQHTYNETTLNMDMQLYPRWRGFRS